MTTSHKSRPSDSKLSLSDVAGLSNVAVSTVSRVLNGTTKNFSVRAEVRQRILDNAEKLGYRPDINAQTLRRGETGYIAVLGLRMLARAIHDPADSVVDLIAARIAARGWHLTTTFVSGDEDAYDLPPWRIDAAVVVRATRPQDFAHLERAGLRYVSLNTPAGPSGASVVVDDRAAMRALTEHLRGLGHRRIAYASQPEADPHVSQNDRLSEYLDVMHGIGEPPVHLTGGDPDSMHEPLRAAMKAGATAIITYNHFMAANLIGAAARLGVSVPGQVSIATYNDEYPVEHLWPAVTSVGHPKEAMADAAVRQLLPSAAGSDALESVCLPMELTVRQSTGPAPA